MTTHEFIRANREVLATMARNGITAEDAGRMAVYEDYLRMLSDLGATEKMGYIVAVLAERHRISERSVLRIVQKFKRAVQ